MAEIFNTDVFQQKLKSSYIGKKIIYTDVTGSTMDDARKLGVEDPEKHPHGSIVIAERQTKARGARDHKWDASNTGNIYASIILHLPHSNKSFEGRFDVEVAACMAVWRVAQCLGVEVIPKWPNDLWVRGHKLAGFLVEDSRFEIPGSNLCLIILGMGINVNADIRQNAELYSIATSLMCERHGVPVSREDFFADVCSALEETLMSRSDNLSNFSSYNLFQKGCDISVTCPSMGQVMDGEFVQICDNWEVKFIDKRTQEVLQGRSDYYTIRPKVLQKIMVVFSGTSGTKTASTLASRLTAIIDTSKFVVCCVPESAITQSDEWMKTCHLLVLAEEVHDSARVISKVTNYLKSGGNLLANGVASCFAARMFEIPCKEGVMEPVADNADFSVVDVEYVGEGHEEKGHESGSSCPYVTFPNSLTCFRFSKDCVMKSLSPGIEKNGAGDFSDNLDTNQSQKSFLALKYHQCEENNGHCTGILTRPTNRGGCIALFGFDLGVTLPSAYSINQGAADGQELETSDMEKTIKVLEKHRFKRDKLICDVLEHLNVK